MKKTIYFSAFTAFVLLFASCEQKPKKETTTEVATTDVAMPDQAQVRTDIQAIENAWADAMNKKDMKTLLTLYADDAVTMSNNALPSTGKAAIQKQIEQDFASKQDYATLSFETIDVFATGNLATETGKTIYKDAAGKEVKTGKYMAVFEKRDGKYICIRDISNMDKK